MIQATPMKQHPTESLAAYVLGMLDASETFQIAEHVRACADCRIEVEQFIEVVGTLPYCADAHTPPAQIKHQLMVRVASAPQNTRVAMAKSPVFAAQRWWQAGFGLAMILALALGGMTVRANQQLAALQQQVASLQQHETAEAQMLSFMASAATTNVALTGTTGAQAQMYMQPGHNRVVIMISGLDKLDADHVYQLWLAQGQTPVPLPVFITDNGVAELMVDAPATIDSYDQVMITVEPRGGSNTPSSQVLLDRTL